VLKQMAEFAGLSSIGTHDPVIERARDVKEVDGAGVALAKAVDAQGSLIVLGRNPRGLDKDRGMRRGEGDGRAGRLDLTDQDLGASWILLKALDAGFAITLGRRAVDHDGVEVFELVFKTGDNRAVIGEHHQFLVRG